MAKYSLINVMKSEGDLILTGYWIQDCNGVTLEQAKQRAKETNEVNGNKLDIAVVEQLPPSVPILNLWHNLKRL